ncbi:MAG: ribbon-helix-helix domain-containing protein [Armatimonadetes bacterium]|nr:ribbon-helix-helix domain-containing protein [Armatimonadota bacterium]
MAHMQLELTEAEARELEAMAKERGVSEAELVQEALRALLRKSERARLKEHAKGIIGMFDSGIPDLATNHDKYLAEAYEQ